jgi:hypothetical protein
LIAAKKQEEIEKSPAAAAAPLCLLCKQNKPWQIEMQ